MKRGQKRSQDKRWKSALKKRREGEKAFAKEVAQRMIGTGVNIPVYGSPPLEPALRILQAQFRQDQDLAQVLIKYAAHSNTGSYAATHGNKKEQVCGNPQTRPND